MKIVNWMVAFLVTACPALGQQWKTYYDSTQQYWAKDWPKTVTLLERAERSALTDLGIYNENYLTILNDLGTAYWKAKRYPQAEKTLAKTLSLKSEVYASLDKEVILSVSNLAGFYAEQGAWGRSKSLYRRIIESDPSQVPPEILVGAAQNLVSLYDMEERADSASFLLALVEKWNVIPVNSELAFQHQYYQAKVSRKLQDYEGAEGKLEKMLAGLKSKREPGLRQLYVQGLQERGILYLQTGAYSRAEKTLLEAYETVTPEMNQDFLLTELANNLAQVYDKLNIFDKALRYYEESLDRCRQSYAENSLPCVILQNNIAGVHLKQENIQQAIGDYQKVIAAFEKLVRTDDPLYITALSNLATAHRKNNDVNAAKQNLEKAWKLLKDSGKERDDLAATVLNNIAVLNTAQGQYAQAAEHYKAAHAIKTAIYGENSVLLLDLISNLAVTYWALDKPQEAIPLFNKSMDLAVRQVAYVFPNLNENEQVQFYQKLKEDFERFNSIAIQWQHKDPSLLSRMFQNRTIIKSLQFFTHQRRSRHIGMGNDPALNELVTQLKDRRDRLGHLYQLPLREIGDGTDVRALEKEIDALEKAISLRSSEALYGDGMTAEEVKWQSLVSTLQADEAIIEMVRFRKYDRQSSRKKDLFGFTDSVYYAALILTRDSKTRPDVVVLKDGNNLETRFFNYYKNAMKYNLSDGLSYHFYWAPIEKRLSAKTRVYFSADGVYHRININTLKDAKTNKFVLDKFDIVYLLNPIQIVRRETPAKVRRNAVLMGDPVFDVEVTSPRERGVGIDHFVALPGTQEELRAIDRVLKGHAWKTSLFVKGGATEANLKQVSSPGILHLASHGFFSSDVVALNAEAKNEFLFHSGIVLTGANKSLVSGSESFDNDGIVTAYEVMNLNLANTHLVVLSACETGLGKIENGEGVFGLQRSFMQAGARNVLISLWKVDDAATRDLMIKFYEYLARGESFHNSLRKAQAEQAQLVDDPSLWGGFVLVGNN